MGGLGGWREDGDAKQKADAGLASARRAERGCMDHGQTRLESDDEKAMKRNGILKRRAGTVHSSI